MDQKVTRRALLGAGLALPLIAGCGSGSGGAGGADTSRGTLKLTLNIPPSKAAGKPSRTRAFGGFVPLGTRAVSISVINPATGAALATPQLITAPFASTTAPPPTLVTASFANLPVGSVTVQISAFPDAAGQQPALATGTATAQIASASTTNVTIPFVLTLAKFTINPQSVELPSVHQTPGGTQTITAVPVDSANRILQYPIQWLSESPDIATVTFDPANSLTAVVHAVFDGVSGITAIEPNSGMTVSVGAFVGG